jgi:hypothetical protein
MVKLILLALLALLAIDDMNKGKGFGYVFGEVVVGVIFISLL